MPTHATSKSFAFFANLRVGKRLALLLAAFLMMILMLGGLVFLTLGEVQVNGPLYARLVLGKDLVADILPPPKYIVESNLVVHELALTSSTDEITAGEVTLRRLRKEYDDRQVFWEKAELDDQLHRTLVIESNQFAQAFFKVAFEQYLPALKAGNKETALVHLRTMKADYAQHRSLIDTTVKRANELNAELETHANDFLKEKLANLAEATFLMLALIVALSMAITRGITRPLSQAVDSMQQIAKGDLTAAVPNGGKDEIGTLFQAMASMQSGLREIVGTLQEHAQQLASASEQLAVSASQSLRTSEQSTEAATSMAASVEEMSVSIDQVGSNAHDAKAMAYRSGEQSEQGGKVVHAAAAEMGKIAAAVNDSAASIRNLENYTSEISNIVNVIREIAEQTNLLALNAAIEAARAGEQGRGFAVVADEVRKLAERTSQSTSQISSVIEKVQNGAQDAVSEMESSVGKVNQGVELAQSAGNSISDIQKSSVNVVNVVEDISNSLHEQSSAALEVARGVEQIAQMAEENRQVVERTEHFAHDLKNLAVSMAQSVKRFRT